jgi:hypothetical protein
MNTAILIGIIGWYYWWIGGSMGLKSWWAGADPVGKNIVKWFGVLVLLGVVVTAIQCGV